MWSEWNFYSGVSYTFFMGRVSDLLRNLFGGVSRERFRSLEKRVENLESDVARESDVELVRHMVEDLRDGSGSASKEELVQKRILSLVERGLDKGEVREKVVDVDSICSESYFYQNWNSLLDKKFIVEQDSDGSVKKVVEGMPQ
jgi:hypothetical protein